MHSEQDTGDISMREMAHNGQRVASFGSPSPMQILALRGKGMGYGMRVHLPRPRPPVQVNIKCRQPQLDGQAEWVACVNQLAPSISCLQNGLMGTSAHLHELGEGLSHDGFWENETG